MVNWSEILIDMFPKLSEIREKVKPLEYPALLQ